VFATHAGAIGNGFLYDDYHLIVENPAVLTHDWTAVWTSPDAASRDAAGRGFRPATLSSYLIDHALGGGRPAVYHATQLGLHLGVVWLVYLVATAVGLAPRWGAVAAFVVGLHPMQTEAVHYLSARSSVLSTLGVLVSFWAYRRGHDEPTGARAWSAVSLAGLALAVLGKESAAVGVVWFVAYERLAARATWSETARRVSLHAAVAAACLVPAALALRQGGPGASTAFGVATATGVSAIGRHLAAVMIPVGLDPVTPHRWVGWTQPTVWIAVAAIAVLCAVGYAFRARAPIATWGIVCGVSGLVPVMALPFVTNVALVQPHRAYQAVVGLALALAAVLAAGETHLLAARDPARARRSMRVLGPALAVGIAVVLVVVDVDAGRVWRDEVGFWTRAAASYPGEASYRHSLGVARLRAGDAVGAVEDLSRATALDPELPRAAYNLGVVYTRLGRRDEAIAAYESAVTRDASDVKAWANVGRLFETRGDTARALAAYRTALELAPQVTAIRDRIAALEGMGTADRPVGGRP
jgi:hypothetical protein